MINILPYTVDICIFENDDTIAAVSEKNSLLYYCGYTIDINIQASCPRQKAN
jgi:hypothetical protein